MTFAKNGWISFAQKHSQFEIWALATEKSLDVCCFCNHVSIKWDLNRVIFLYGDFKIPQFEVNYYFSRGSDIVEAKISFHFTVIKFLITLSINMNFVSAFDKQSEIIFWFWNPPEAEHNSGCIENKSNFTENIEVSSEGSNVSRQMPFQFHWTLLFWHACIATSPEARNSDSIEIIQPFSGNVVAISKDGKCERRLEESVDIKQSRVISINTLWLCIKTVMPFIARQVKQFISVVFSSSAAAGCPPRGGGGQQRTGGSRELCAEMFRKLIKGDQVN